MRKWPERGTIVVQKAIFAWLFLVCSCWIPGSQDGDATGLTEEQTLTGCAPQDCGLNGVWMGGEVPFRTLYIPSPKGSGQPNNKGVYIKDFRWHNISLDLDVVGDELVGIDPSTTEKITGTALQEAQIILMNTGGQTWKATITEVLSPQFWTACAAANSNSACLAARSTTPAYRLVVTSGSDNRPVELCQPGLADGSNFEGTVVIFRGDSYNEGTLEISNTSGQDSSFNIACYGSVLSKLHFSRHTAAAMGAFAFPVPQRQAMLRLLTGDYCGDGQHLFTTQGHPIRMGFGAGPFLPRFTEVGLAGALSLDAMWKRDGTGASCIRAPRLSVPQGTSVNVTAALEDQLISEIQAACQASGRPAPPKCVPERWLQVKNGYNGIDYLASANLFYAP